jgi:hypothetical protein
MAINSAQLKQDFEAMAKSSAAISKSLSEALSPEKSAKLADNLEKGIEQVKDIFSTWDKDLRKAKEKFREIGRELDIPEEKREAFAEQKTKALEEQKTKDFTDKLREIQKLSGRKDEDMTKYAKKNFGEPGSKFTPQSELTDGIEGSLNKLTLDSQKAFTDFWGDKLPKTLGTAGDAFGAFFTDVAFKSKSTSDAFDAMGKTLQGIVQQIAQDFVNAGVRMALFGAGGSGAGGMSGMGGLAGLIGGLFPNAKGGVYASPALSAYSNAIVAGPTMFAFARGGVPRIGLMGEAGPEAVMPLRRGLGGRLGVDASGIGGAQGPAPQVNVIINTPPGVEAQTQQTQNSSGGMDMTVMLEMVDKHMAGGFASGRSKSANALRMAQGGM